MTREPRGFGDAMLARMDRWSEQSHWLPEPIEWFPSRVFWGIFVWNFPILLIALVLIGVVMYKSDPSSLGIGFFSSLPWVVELGIGSLSLALGIDLFACLYLRHTWNRRARQHRKDEAAAEAL